MGRARSGCRGAVHTKGLPLEGRGQCPRWAFPSSTQILGAPALPTQRKLKCKQMPTLVVNSQHLNFQRPTF